MLEKVIHNYSLLGFCRNLILEKCYKIWGKVDMFSWKVSLVKIIDIFLDTINNG